MRGFADRRVSRRLAGAVLLKQPLEAGGPLFGIVALDGHAYRRSSALGPLRANGSVVGPFPRVEPRSDAAGDALGDVFVALAPVDVDVNNARGSPVRLGFHCIKGYSIIHAGNNIVRLAAAAADCSKNLRKTLIF